MRKNVPIPLRILLSCALVWVFLSCGEHPELPTDIQTHQVSFGANDTSFVRISPDWDQAHGYPWVQPGDIQIGRDGMIFVVNHNPDYGDGGQVVQLSGSGSIRQDHLFANQVDPSHPILGIGQDSKLNLFMVNGTENIYLWNQYVHDVGVTGVVQEFIYYNDLTGDTLHVDVTSETVWDAFTPLINDPGVEFADYEVIDAVIEQNPDTVASVEGEYLFYSDTTRFGTQFTDVDGGIDRAELIYVSDRYSDRIIGLEVRYKRAIQLGNGNIAFTYFGAYDPHSLVATFGQGQASTNNPTSLVSQKIGATTSAIYFTQIAGNFLVQKVRGSGEEWVFDIQNTQSGIPEVIELDYFEAPHAIAVGETDERGLGLFYVADSTQNRVPAFFSNGFFFREVAAEKHLVDMEPGERLGDILQAMGLELDPGLNPEISSDSLARVEFELSLNEGQSIDDVLDDPLLVEEIFQYLPQWRGYIADETETILIAYDKPVTVQVLTPVLNGPKGVGTREGVVYIADSGNNRILRFQRSDVASYLPDEGN